MAKLRIFIVLLVFWVIALFNIERFDSLNLNIPSSLYLLTGIGLLPTILLPSTGQLRFEYISIPVIILYITMRYFGLASSQAFTIQAIALESIVLVFTLWIGRKISVNLEGFETVVDEIVFEADSSRILSMTDGEDAVNNELFRARKYERPVAILYLKLPSISRMRRIHPDTLQYQLSLEHRYYKTRIARIVESLVYRVDILVWYGDNLVICLPETTVEQAQQLATQITEVISSTIILQVPIGIAGFPQDGLIYTDLVAEAEKKIKVYHDEDDRDYFDNNNSSPEAQDDPMAQTYSSRKELQPVPELSTFQRFSEALKSLIITILQDNSIVPPMSFDATDLSEQRLYHNPDYWVNRIPHQSTSARLIYHRIKRLTDICAVLVVSPLLLLIFFAVGVAIKLEDGGSIFYSQNRTGLGGRKFKMYKFRSMVQNADKRMKELGVSFNERNETVDASGAKLNYDPRITKVGNFIRKTSLDELPQLWNVLTGDMSIVGPRPTSFDVDKYQLYHTERLSVKPGITGLWQIHDRGDTDFDNRLIWDIRYIDKFSLIMDVNILFRTLSTVVNKKGAR
jgi:lipopolysaccharide/colanic/teichoic acid biosynthesis glycosyltransferase/GGDEF domain-containing protein